MPKSINYRPIKFSQISNNLNELNKKKIDGLTPHGLRYNLRFNSELDLWYY